MKIYRKRNIFYLVGCIVLFGGAIAFADKVVPGNNEEDSALEVEACGVERWSVKVLTDADASNVNIVPVNTTVAGLCNLTTPTPNSNMPRQKVEEQTYKIHCTVGEIKLESDGDYHLTLLDSNGNHLIGEIPDPTCNATTSSLYFGDITRCRQFIDKNFNVTGSFQTVNKRFVVTGVAFVDPPHGQTDAAPNNLELHSILDIEFEPVHTSGIAENESAEKSIFVYPNPIQNEAHFRLNFNGQLHEEGVLKLYDMKGQEMQSMVWPSDQMEVSLQRNGLRNGIYFYRLFEGANAVAAGKILAQ